MTSQSEIQKLLVVQAHDLKLRQFERELKDIPQRKTREQSRLATHLSEVTAADTQMKRLQAELKKLELEAESVRAKVARVRQQQLELKSNEAFRISENEIATYQREIAGIEDKELGLMEQLEAARGAQDTNTRALAAEQAVVQSDCAAWDERSAALQTQLRAEEALRAVAVRNIDPEWLARYMQIWKRKDRALVPLEQGVCGGCHMQQPPYVVHDVRKRNEMVACGFCGRLLYYSE